MFGHPLFRFFADVKSRYKSSRYKSDISHMHPIKVCVKLRFNDFLNVSFVNLILVTHHLNVKLVHVVFNIISHNRTDIIEKIPLANRFKLSRPYISPDRPRHKQALIYDYTLTMRLIYNGRQGAFHMK